VAAGLAAALRIAGAEVTAGSSVGATSLDESLLVRTPSDPMAPVDLAECTFEAVPGAFDGPEAEWPVFFDAPDVESAAEPGDEPAEAPDESVGSPCATPVLVATATPNPTATASPPTRDTYFAESIGFSPL
jgi:hypothetical protein